MMNSEIDKVISKEVNKEIDKKNDKKNNKEGTTKVNVAEYIYKYEMHLHTSEASACSHCSADMMVEAHKKAGYTGIFVTNHAWGGNTCIDRSLPYEEWVKRYVKAYDIAAQEGAKIGLDVYFGMESGFRGTEFLIYGITPDWLIKNKKLWDANIAKQFDMIHEGGGIVVHAHPYREEPYIPEIKLYPEYIDAVETINASHSSHLSKAHNKPEFDEKAIMYARKNNLPQVSGSDIHSVDVLGGGILFKERQNSDKAIIAAIMTRGDYLLTNGDHIYNNNGEFIV